MLDGPESSLAWDINDLKDSARARRAPAMGRAACAEGPAMVGD